MNTREHRLRSKIDELRDQLNEERVVQAHVLKDMRHRLRVANGKVSRRDQLEREAMNKVAFEQEVAIIEDAAPDNAAEWATYERIIRQCSPESTVDIAEHAAIVMATVLKARANEAIRA